MDNKERLKRIFILILIAALVVAAFFIIKQNTYKKGEISTGNSSCINYYNQCLCLGALKEIEECYGEDCSLTQYECSGWEVCWDIDGKECN